MLSDLLTLSAIVYAFLFGAFTYGVSRARYPTATAFPKVSIVVAARNEESNITACLDSLAGLSYPRDRLEVFVVDDQSSDATLAKLVPFAAAFPHIHILTSDPAQGSLKGKTNALVKGIEASSGEILMFTDADCRVPTDWVEQTVKYYTNDKVGVVAGFTELIARNWFEGIQTLDWFVLFSVAAGTIRLNFPVTAVGNNLSVRRAAYDAVGGYRKVPFSVTEDYALFHAITSSTRYVAKFPLDGGMLIQSVPCATPRDLFRQKQRWFAGGKDMEAKHIAVFAATFLFNLLLIIGAATLNFSVMVFPITVKVVFEIFLLLPALKEFSRWGLLRYYPLYLVWNFLALLVFPVLAVSTGKVRWKGRTLSNEVVPKNEHAL